MEFAGAPGSPATVTDAPAIGKELWVTEQTVKFHLTNIYRKLDLANRTEAARYAYEHGLVDSPLALFLGSLLFNAAIGVLLFVAPWVVGYSGLTGAAWTSWLVGAIVVVVGLTVVVGATVVLVVLTTTAVLL